MMNSTNKRSFEKWLDEADLPAETKDGWVDLETGFTYQDYVRGPSTAERRAEKLAFMTRKHGAEIEEAEAAAKKASWAPMTGTTPQKAWAAQIRAKLIPKLQASTQELAGRIRTAKFWIEERSKDISTLEVTIEKKRDELEYAAQVRKEAAIKARATRLANKDLAIKIARRNEILLELLDDAKQLAAVPAILGTKVLDKDGIRIFLDLTRKIVVFIIKIETHRETRQALLDPEREALIISTMAQQ